jgi:hypothetical protein
MTIKASGHSALIFAAGLLVCFAGALPATAAGADSTAASKSEAATSGKSVRHATRHWKRYTHRKATRVASKSSESRKAAEKDLADASNSPPEIPATVANANAQMAPAIAQTAAADALADSASAMTAKANTMLLASADKPTDPQASSDAPVAASDQLNDVDRALQETPARQTVAMVSAAKPVAAAAALAPADDSATWDTTSLIGKIFIAFGALLTLASAARMFMA